MNANALYELKPDEFVRLCAEMLATQGFDSVGVVGGAHDGGVDILATAQGHRVAVQVKHARQVEFGTVADAFRMLLDNPYEAKELLFITSAPLSSVTKEGIKSLIPKGFTVRSLGRDDVLAFVAKHQPVKGAVLSAASDRAVAQRRKIWFGVALSLLSAAATFLTYFVGPNHKAPLDSRIETVEKAIGSIRDLEQYLADIKDDMVATKHSVNAIEAEYAKAKELEKLTAAQVQAVQSALRAQTWREVALNYVLGFVIGLASSFLASALYSRWKQWSALRG